MWLCLQRRAGGPLGQSGFGWAAPEPPPTAESADRWIDGTVLMDDGAVCVAARYSCADIGHALVVEPERERTPDGAPVAAAELHDVDSPSAGCGGPPGVPGHSPL